MIETVHPDAIYPVPDWQGHQLDEPMQCPRCGKVEAMGGYDIIGADPGCVFCTDCHQEIRT